MIYTLYVWHPWYTIFIFGHHDTQLNVWYKWYTLFWFGIPDTNYLLGYLLGYLEWLRRRLLHDRVRDSTTVVNSLSPQMSELVEDAIASWCGDIVGHFWLIRNGLEKLVELKFEFLGFNTFDVSQIFWQRVVQPMPKYSDCILLKGLCRASVCWMLNNALCSMSWMFSVFYCVPHCAINIWHHMLCYLPYIYNYITFTASLERVQLLLLLLNKVGSARLGEGDTHPISPKTPAPQYQSIDRKKRKGKRVEDYSRDRVA